MKLQRIILNIARQFLGFHTKLMSNCANKLVFTIRLIFLFIFYMSYSTWKINLVKVYEYFHWNHVCNKIIDKLICGFERYALICTIIWETNYLDWDDVKKYWRIVLWDLMTVLNQDSMQSCLPWILAIMPCNSSEMWSPFIESDNRHAWNFSISGFNNCSSSMGIHDSWTLSKSSSSGCCSSI